MATQHVSPASAVVDGAAGKSKTALSWGLLEAFGWFDNVENDTTAASKTSDIRQEAHPDHLLPPPYAGALPLLHPLPRWRQHTRRALHRRHGGRPRPPPRRYQVQLVPGLLPLPGRRRVGEAVAHAPAKDTLHPLPRHEHRLASPPKQAIHRRQLQVFTR